MNPKEPMPVASPRSIHGSRQLLTCAHRRTLAVDFPIMMGYREKQRESPGAHHLKWHPTKKSPVQVLTLHYQWRLLHRLTHYTTKDLSTSFFYSPYFENSHSFTSNHTWLQYSVRPFTFNLPAPLSQTEVFFSQNNEWHSAEAFAKMTFRKKEKEKK